MSRKTFSVDEFRTRINDSLCHSHMYEHGRPWRLGLIDALESVLHSTGNYKGYRYLTSNELADGELPGIQYLNGQPAPYPERFENTDDTRRSYF